MNNKGLVDMFYDLALIFIIIILVSIWIILLRSEQKVRRDIITANIEDLHQEDVLISILRTPLGSERFLDRFIKAYSTKETISFEEDLNMILSATYGDLMCWKINIDNEEFIDRHCLTKSTKPILDASVLVPIENKGKKVNLELNFVVTGFAENNDHLAKTPWGCRAEWNDGNDNEICDPSETLVGYRLIEEGESHRESTGGNPILKFFEETRCRDIPCIHEAMQISKFEVPELEANEGKEWSKEPDISSCIDDDEKSQLGDTACRSIAGATFLSVCALDESNEPFWYNIVCNYQCKASGVSHTCSSPGVTPPEDDTDPDDDSEDTDDDQISYTSCSDSQEDVEEFLKIILNQPEGIQWNQFEQYSSDPQEIGAAWCESSSSIIFYLCPEHDQTDFDDKWGWYSYGCNCENTPDGITQGACG